MEARPTPVRFSRLRMLAGAGCAALLIAVSAVDGAAAQSARANFNIRSAALSQSLLEFGRQAGISVAADQSLTAGLRGAAVSGEMPVGEALDRLLAGTGLKAEFAGPNAVRLVRAGQGDAGGNDLRPSGQDGGQDATAVADVIVTAQKREESIQDVPIAVSAFSAETLDAMKIEGGSELLRAIPNVSFSKANFSMYNFSIRGIGTKAVSASSDPAVAVSFNNTPLIRNRLFEQEYLDVNRVEVLRGPQGTLYGRNATAGVVNMIPNLPGPDFDAMLKAETGNYGSMRGQMMVNIPLADTFWVRAAGSITKRDGFDYNIFKDTWVNGRDLYSTRLSAAWTPSDRFNLNIIWEHFGEDDNRARTGKQLCTRDPGPTHAGAQAFSTEVMRGRLSQGCLPSSLYSDAAYSTPNGTGMAQIWAAGAISYGKKRVGTQYVANYAIDIGEDPYANRVQSRDLREIETTYDPRFVANNDIYQLNARFDINENLTAYYQVAYSKDDYWSTQDYMRYISNDIINDSDNSYDPRNRPFPTNSLAAPGGYYSDPQLGSYKRMVSADLSKSDNEQLYHEVRIQSDYDSKFNFNLGANYIKFDTKDDYYVFNNIFSLIAEYRYNFIRGPFSALATSNCSDGSAMECVYVDKSSIDNLVGDGHNYFRSKNEVSIRSWGVFGEGYYDISDKIRATLGLRYTDDKKTSTPYPSQLLLGAEDRFNSGPLTGGSVVRGYPALPDIVQSWSAVTGRFVVDWKPSDDVMAYASYARGYKGGGTNPPRPGLDSSVVQYLPLAETFDPEYVNAFEVGLKTNLLNNRIKFNATAFYYDYKDYQVSQIVDRISLNENFDAKSMGLEFELSYSVTNNFRLDANVGYLKTKIGSGEGSIDVMNRTQGNKDWMVVRPWVQVPSNCVAPTRHVEKIMASIYTDDFKHLAIQTLCGGALRVGSFDPDFESQTEFWNMFGIVYNPIKDAPNSGRGFNADLSGNELPNSPNFTANIGAQYDWKINSFNLSARADYYFQSESYFRVYNTEYDRLKSWDSVNLSLSAESHDGDVVVSFYVKNVFDNSPIVDAFTNSDDSMLTTNIFTLDPRIVGFSLMKRY